MAEQKVRCKECDVEFLRATAQCTDGLCMPCYNGEPRKALGGREEKLSSLGWVGAILGFVGFMVISSLVVVFIGVAAALIAKVVFQASWNTASAVGIGTYIILKFLGSLPFGDDPEAEAEERRKKRAELAKKWKERNSGSD